MEEINWLLKWGDTFPYPDETEISNEDYEKLLEDHVKAWMKLCNPRKKKGTKYKLRHFEVVGTGENTFKAIAFLKPEVEEGPHAPGQGVPEGFFEHLIPPAPPPPPDKLE